MDQDDKMAQYYKALVKALNMETPADSEYGALNAYEALTKNYGLKRCRTPPNSKHISKKQTYTAKSGIFSSLGECSDALGDQGANRKGQGD